MTGPQVTVALALRGPAWDDGQTLREQAAVTEHLEFMASLVRSGVVETGGPLLAVDERLHGDIVGLLLFSEAEPETAASVLAEDPAQTAGTLRWEVRTWHR